MMKMDWTTWHRRWHKYAFYARHAYLDCVPHGFAAPNAREILAEYARLPADVQRHVRERMDYYHRLNESVYADKPYRAGAFLRLKPSAYYYDLKALLRYFPDDWRFDCLFGDITHIPPQPTFVKSRPISDNNHNSIVLKLDSVRHFYIYPCRVPFSQKMDKLVWRGAAHQPHRVQFLEKYHAHPLCDVGCVHKKSKNTPYHRAYLSVKEQLRYRYILSIEGNDVATNLKWIMASHSLCLMTRPRFETWLMEGRLQPDVHYVALQDDYADLDEKLAFYRANPRAAEKIIANARQWMRPFFDEKLELLISLMVMQKYADHVMAR